jgi:hypothetical protein
MSEGLHNRQAHNKYRHLVPRKGKAISEVLGSHSSSESESVDKLHRKGTREEEEMKRRRRTRCCKPRAGKHCSTKTPILPPRPGNILDASLRTHTKLQAVSKFNCVSCSRCPSRIEEIYDRNIGCETDILPTPFRFPWVSAHPSSGVGGGGGEEKRNPTRLLLGITNCAFLTSALDGSV